MSRRCLPLSASLCFGLTALAVALCYGSENAGSGQDPTWRFAETLYSTGRFKEAAVEFQRFLFALPDSAERQRANAWLRTIDAYRQARRFDLAIQCLDTLETVAGIGEEVACRARIARARCLYANGDYRAALGTLSLIPPCGETHPDLARQVILLNATQDLHLGAWRIAIETLSPSSGADSIAGERTPTAARLRSLADRGAKMHPPSPLVASALSAGIPGLGRVYAGRTAEGLFSFALNAIAIWQCVDGFHDDGRSSLKGWAAGTIGLLFYTGNVYGSAVTAKQVHATETRTLMEEIDTTVEREIGP